MESAKPISSSQDVETSEGLVFFPQYSSSNMLSKRVLRTLIAFQIINLSCIIVVVVLIATTIGVYKAINDTILRNNITPYIANVQGIPVIAVVAFSLAPLRAILWKHSTQSQPVMQFRFLATIVFGLSIILWSLAILVLLIRSDSLPGDLCWSGVERGEAVEKGCCIRAMQVCGPRIPLQSRTEFALTFHQTGSLIYICVVLYLELIGLIMCCAYTESLLTG